MAEEKIMPPMSRMMGRRMNSQMNISLPIEMHEKLRAIAWEERIPPLPLVPVSARSRHAASWGGFGGGRGVCRRQLGAGDPAARTRRDRRSTLS